ncbi:MAG TPA: hypothetical protein VKE22_12380 [Haliangiales bacterium]|nr:hypothetical protein [Haliangiales bacterium]
MRGLLFVCALLLAAAPAAAAKKKRAPAAATAVKKAAPAPAPGPTKKAPPKKAQPAAAPQPDAAADGEQAPVATPPSVSPAGGVVGVKTEGKGKLKTYDFTAMGIEGKVLTPQIMYLLGRIKVELEKSDLEKRSFMPELVRSVDEGGI